MLVSRRHFFFCEVGWQRETRTMCGHCMAVVNLGPRPSRAKIRKTKKLPGRPRLGSSGAMRFN